MADFGTLMSGDTDDCISDLNLMETAVEMEQEFLKVSNGESENHIADDNDSVDDSADDLADDECLTDVESEVAMINDGLGCLNTDDGSLSPSTTGEVDTSTSGASDRFNITGKSRTTKKPVGRFSPLRSNQLNRRYWNSSCNIGSSSSYSSGATSVDESAPPKKDRSQYTFNKATFVYKSPYGLYNIQIKRKIEPSPRPKAMMQNHGFNKSSFNYVSPYGVLYLMTNGKMEGVGRRSASLPVFNKRLQLAESKSMLKMKMVRKGSIEGPTDDFCLDDFNDDNYEVVISSQRPSSDVCLEQLYLNVNDDITQVRNPSRRSSPIRERGTDNSDSDPFSDSGSVDTGRGEEICTENNSLAEVDFARSLKKKIFETFDGDTITAMDPETFADYIGSQSMIDMLEKKDEDACIPEMYITRDYDNTHRRAVK